MKIQVKRIYNAPVEHEGKRILVDRLWPRGLSKDKAKIDYWAKDIAPSNDLRKWYNHEANKWNEFKQRYFEELNNNQSALHELLSNMDDPTSFLYSSKELNLNNAYALKEYLVSYALKNDSKQL